MGKVTKIAQAGTLESSDVMVTVAPGEVGSGVKVEVESIVMAQYGAEIKRVLEATVASQNVTDVYVKAADRGALDCTLKARLLTALSRAGVEVKEGVLC
ncbi:citrate lyase acyl carrier protein [Azotosporobacter soli]|uniref:citrate lyase acyl carrier protein n=1 Tax=Azotosporobacter soli TaxID=3055040 RepID=UPI0031FE4F12